MTLRERVRSYRRQRRAEGDHVALDSAAGHLVEDYRRAVVGGASRQALAEILTGIAGCELAMSRTNPAMGWGLDRDEDGVSVGESCRWAGLLVQELAYCAGDEPRKGLPEYRGVRAFEFQTEQIAAALMRLAVAYRREDAAVGRRLSDLWHAVVELVGGQAAEVLVPLMAAHGFEGWDCDCGKHGVEDAGDSVEVS